MDHYENLGVIGEGYVQSADVFDELYRMTPDDVCIVVFSTYGVVIKARHKVTGQLVAIKKFKVLNNTITNTYCIVTTPCTGGAFDMFCLFSLSLSLSLCVQH